MTAAWGHGLATVTTDGGVLDTWFHTLGWGDRPAELPEERVAGRTHAVEHRVRRGFADEVFVWAFRPQSWVVGRHDHEALADHVEIACFRPLGHDRFPAELWLSVPPRVQIPVENGAKVIELMAALKKSIGDGGKSKAKAPAAKKKAPAKKSAAKKRA